MARRESAKSPSESRNSSAARAATCSDQEPGPERRDLARELRPKNFAGWRISPTESLCKACVSTMDEASTVPAKQKRKKSRRLSQATAEEAVAAAAAPAASAEPAVSAEPTVPAEPAAPAAPAAPSCPPRRLRSPSRPSPAARTPRPRRARRSPSSRRRRRRAAWRGRRTRATPRSTCGRRCSCSRPWAARRRGRRCPPAAGARRCRRPRERGGGGGRRRAARAALAVHDDGGGVRDGAEARARARGLGRAAVPRRAQVDLVPAHPRLPLPPNRRDPRPRRLCRDRTRARDVLRLPRRVGVGGEHRLRRAPLHGRRLVRLLEDLPLSRAGAQFGAISAQFGAIIRAMRL